MAALCSQQYSIKSEVPRNPKMRRMMSIRHTTASWFFEAKRGRALLEQIDDSTRGPCKGALCNLSINASAAQQANQSANSDISFNHNINSSNRSAACLFVTHRPLVVLCHFFIRVWTLDETAAM
jgi:hypothetical protein